jgi:ribosomal protein L21E
MTKLQDTGTAAGRWCILRIAGPQTLPLAASLQRGDFKAWAPQMVIRRRRPRSKVMTEIQAAILPTFVFLQAGQLNDVRRLHALPGSPLPAFSVLSNAGRVPLVSEAQMAALRDEEQRACAAHQAVKDREARLAERSERQRQRAILRASAPTYAAGDRVRITEPAFAGMTGIVERGQGKAAVVNLGGSISLTIEAWLLEPVGASAEAFAAARRSAAT